MSDRDKLTGALEERTGTGKLPEQTVLYNRQIILDAVTIGDWTAYNAKDTTANITTDEASILSTQSIEFDKVDGVDAVVYAGVQKTLATALDLSRFLPDDIVEAWFNIPDITNVASAELILGTDVSNNKKWTLADTGITAGEWDGISATLASGTDVGNGWAPAAITYVALIVNFDAETNALADMLLDSILVRSAR